MNAELMTHYLGAEYAEILLASVGSTVVYIYSIVGDTLSMTAFGITATYQRN